MVSKNLMAASTKPLILTILARGEMYGYQIIQNVIQLSGGTLEWSEGMLYPVLHRM
jgi:PadR family transcriptional regulator PadR